MIIIGYSGHAFVVYGILLAAQKKVIAYCDNEEKAYNPFQLKYLGKESSDTAINAFSSADFFIAIGDNSIREKVYNSLYTLGLQPTNAIHPSAIIDSSVTVAKYGVMIAANATINPLATIGIGVICNTSCIIEHECKIGNFAHIAPGAVVCGAVTIGEKTFVGANAVIKQGIKVGNNVTIGAGAVVVKNIPDNETVIGTPAKTK